MYYTTENQVLVMCRHLFPTLLRLRHIVMLKHCFSHPSAIFWSIILIRFFKYGLSKKLMAKM